MIAPSLLFFSARYLVEKPMTIASGSVAHRVGIAELRPPSKLMRYAVPSISTSTFLQVIFEPSSSPSNGLPFQAYGTNDSEYQLMSSYDVSIFIDDAYVGKSEITNTIAPGRSS